MNLTISGHHLEVTPALRSYVTTKLDRIMRHFDQVVDVKVLLTIENQKEKERRQRAEVILEQMGLADRMGNRPNQLSGGQQQRVAIARALVNQPDLLLADEPTGALDSQTGEAVMDLLAHLFSEGLTIVLVTHDNKIAERTRRIVQIQDGRIV
jgi:putative ABC transport system ATP-binding protein